MVPESIAMHSLAIGQGLYQMEDSVGSLNLTLLTLIVELGRHC